MAQATTLYNISSWRQKKLLGKKAGQLWEVTRQSTVNKGMVVTQI